MFQARMFIDMNAKGLYGKERHFHIEGHQMETSSKVSVIAGDIEIDLEGAPMEVEEQLALHRQDDTWTLMLDRLTQARAEAMQAAVSAAKEKGLPERGSAFRVLKPVHWNENLIRSSVRFTTSEKSKASKTARRVSSTNCSMMQRSIHPVTSRFISID